MVFLAGKLVTYNGIKNARTKMVSGVKWWKTANTIKIWP